MIIFRSFSRVSIVVVVALASSMLASFPAAYAALASDKTTSVTLDVDGNTVGLAKSVTNNAPQTRTPSAAALVERAQAAAIRETVSLASSQSVAGSL